VGLVDLAHAALAGQGEDLVATDLLTCRERHCADCSPPGVAASSRSNLASRKATMEETRSLEP
jgi:hypothetical protein